MLFSAKFTNAPRISFRRCYVGCGLWSAAGHLLVYIILWTLELRLKIQLFRCHQPNTRNFRRLTAQSWKRRTHGGRRLIYPERHTRMTYVSTSRLHPRLLVRAYWSLLYLCSGWPSPCARSCGWAVQRRLLMFMSSSKSNRTYNLPLHKALLLSDYPLRRLPTGTIVTLHYSLLPRIHRRKVDIRLYNCTLRSHWLLTYYRSCTLIDICIHYIRLFNGHFINTGSVQITCSGGIY